MIAKHVVVLELQAGDAGFLAIARLQSRDHAAAVVAQGAHLVEPGIEARRDESAIARQVRQVRRQRALQGLHQACKLSVRREGQRRARPLDLARGLAVYAQTARGGAIAGPQPAAHRRQIARAAAAKRKPG